MFGGNVKRMFTGSAPLSSDILEFLKIAVGCPIIEGYGLTETSAGITFTKGNDQTCGHVGGPSNFVEIKLVDIPEMNYFSTDKDLNG